ncbi:MAG TPA: cytochrome c [Candidatus Acidoferrum sp.]|nr:cytochrome c [Candidatus Acidoferrum sp.]
MRNFLAGMLFAAVVLFLGGFAYLRLGFAEVRGDLPPGQWESAFMFSSVHASVRRRAPEISNPVPATDENLIAGGKIYSDECAGCHGAAGKPDQTSESLYPPIPQLPVRGTDYTEAQIFWVAKHGIRFSGMFANGKWDSDQKLWTVAAYIKRIKSLPPHVQEQLAKPVSK